MNAPFVNVAEALLGLKMLAKFSKDNGGNGTGHMYCLRMTPAVAETFQLSEDGFVEMKDANSDTFQDVSFCV